MTEQFLLPGGRRSYLHLHLSSLSASSLDSLIIFFGALGYMAALTRCWSQVILTNQASRSPHAQTLNRPPFNGSSKLPYFFFLKKSQKAFSTFKHLFLFSSFLEPVRCTAVAEHKLYAPANGLPGSELIERKNCMDSKDYC